MKMRALLSLLALLLFAANAPACGMGEKVDGYENATVQHAHEHWLAGKRSPIPFLFIDVRTTVEYAKGHIDGARLIPVQELDRRLAEVPKDKRVYVYCHSGKRSALASKILAEAGYTNIENVEGGIEAWKRAGYPVVK